MKIGTIGHGGGRLQRSADTLRQAVERIGG